MTQPQFQKALYYAVRESVNNSKHFHIDNQHDALIREAIAFVESFDDEIPYEWAKVEAESLAECANRRFGTKQQPKLFV